MEEGFEEEFNRSEIQENSFSMKEHKPEWTIRRQLMQLAIVKSETWIFLLLVFNVTFNFFLSLCVRQMEDMQPYYIGFRGAIEQTHSNSANAATSSPQYISRGVVKKINNTTIEVKKKEQMKKRTRWVETER